MPARRLQAPEPHPALGVLRQRRITNRRVADLLGVSAGWVGAVLLGQVRVPADFRRGLAELLDLPAEELFRHDELSPKHPGDAALHRGTIPDSQT